MRVLLTGGLGYLGGRLSQFLAAAGGCEIVLGTRRTAQPVASTGDAAVVPVDWSSDESLRNACRNVAAVVHLAGMNAADCAHDPAAALQLYGVGTGRLVRAAVTQGVRRLIYVSSVHVYGAALCGDVDELTIPEPRHPYAVSHLAAEDTVRAADAPGAFEGIVLRLANVYGAPADAAANCWTLLTNDLCRQAVNDRRMVLRTAGTQARDFIAMSEACRAIAHLLTVPAHRLPNRTLNVGSGSVMTIWDMAQKVAERARAVLGFATVLHAGRGVDPVGSELRSFSIQRLLASGFEPQPSAINHELDGLLTFVDRSRGHAA